MDLGCGRSMRFSLHIVCQLKTPVSSRLRDELHKVYDIIESNLRRRCDARGS